MALPIEEYVKAVAVGVLSNAELLKKFAAGKKQTAETFEEYFARRVWEFAQALKDRETP